METEMEKIIKEKEQAARMSIVPLQAVPLKAIPTTTSCTKNTRKAEDQLESTVENMSLQIE